MPVPVRSRRFSGNPLDICANRLQNSGMASTTVLSDDFDPTITTDVETLSFAYKGKEYVIDLGVENQKEADEIFGAYIEKARSAPSGGTKRGRGAGTPRPTSGNSDASVIREWAEANGYKGPDGGALPKRGRISAEIREAYEAANPTA